MPKEIVYDQAGMYDLHVGWSSPEVADAGAGTVQVGIEVHGGNSLLDQLAPKLAELLDRHGIARDELELVTWRGIWGTFDRAGVNRAIRLLRHARDQAYGRDE